MHSFCAADVRLFRAVSQCNDQPWTMECHCTAGSVTSVTDHHVVSHRWSAVCTSYLKIFRFINSAGNVLSSTTVDNGEHDSSVFSAQEYSSIS
jgi:hypothetical protein